jgi:predicted dienelactone hydrolase|uniref:alpha/beta fold hydrolase n=1 Tax=Cyanobium sp. TaxID=2164130 RepID=UPI00404A4957
MISGAWRGLLLGALLSPLMAMPAARALEEIVIKIPLLDTDFTVRVGELRDPRTLRTGTSDLAELDRASGGAVGRELLALLNQPVPLSLAQVANGSVGSPLLEQAMFVLSSLGTLEGRSPDLSGKTLRDALIKASKNGEPTLLSLIEAIPGKRVILNLGRARQIVSRMAQQRQRAEQLLAATPPANARVAPLLPRNDVLQSSYRLAVPHRAQPIELEVLQPRQGGNGHLVLVSHGLWDGPASFQGWGTFLAGQGYTVILPRHPGSDKTQQQEVLTGEAPPPGPEELALRPKDLKAVMDAVEAGRLGGFIGVDASHVVVIGHSWGATSALQLAGVRPKQGDLLARCGKKDDPSRNLSWTLQCSWLKGVDQAALQDSRVIAVAAVSPPVSLLFPRGSGQNLSARVLLVSGGRDWVVPPDPEAVTPMEWGSRLGNRLVLVQGGDHFNLRPGSSANGGVLGPLLLAWTNAAFASGAAVRPSQGAVNLLPANGWGSALMPMADVTDKLNRP